MTKSGLHPTLQAMREYVTAGDEHRYDQLPPGFIRVDVTHSNLEQVWHDITFHLDSEILSVKEKLYRKGGTPAGSMDLYLRGKSGSVFLYDSSKTLRHFGAQSGDYLHIVDTDPHSISANGALENVNLVEKYMMSDEAYDQRDNTLRAHIKKERARDPNFKLQASGAPNAPPPEPVERPPTPSDFREKFVVGSRCEVNPGGRRGELAFAGSVPGLDGHWVGVRLDEPQGQSEGLAPDGTRMFDCPKGKGYGCFSRWHKVTVGDFPEVDPFASDDEI